MITVVIPCRNEHLTGNTIHSVFQTAQVPVEVILVEDQCHGHKDLPVDRRLRIVTKKTAEGVDRARHTGILAARYPVIVVMDAHMVCEPGWDTIIVKHLEKYPDAVSCCQCPSLDSNLTISPRDIGYIGACISFMHHDMQYFGWSVFQPKWTDAATETIQSGKPSQIGCVLGACYSFLRDRYLKIGAPWEFLWGWGWSEPLLSLANWCFGGNSWVLPCRIGHYFRTGQFDKVPYTTLISRILHNQMLLIDSFPMSEPLRYDLNTHFHLGREQCFYSPACYEEAEQMRIRVTGSELGMRFKTAPRNLDEYQQIWPCI